jgi:hypothetical protein
MRLVVDAGRWVLGPPIDHPPAAAVLEVSGAVLEWTVDDPNGAAATRITLTDIAAADWLWRVVGPVGHAALLAAVAEHPGTEVLDLAGVEAAAEVLAPLRRLGVGHWLRRWWPESSREGIVGLDSAVLDGELALLTNLTQEFFTEDTLDSDLEGLLAPHRSRLLALAGDGDPRVAAMARACADLADDVGVWSSAGTAPDGAPSSARREDYALAAGRHGDRDSAAIAGGVGSVDWMAVPPSNRRERAWHRRSTQLGRHLRKRRTRREWYCSTEAFGRHRGAAWREPGMGPRLVADHGDGRSRTPHGRRGGRGPATPARLRQGTPRASRSRRIPRRGPGCRIRLLKVRRPERLTRQRQCGNARGADLAGEPR